jgi:ribonucleoside-triphosphate reductase
MSVYEAAGEAVLGEYTLLSVFPRDIGDAHLSGSIHIGNMSSWTLKPEEIVHDLRKFFQHGMRLSRADSSQGYFPPPQDFESALSTVLNVLLHSSKEINGAQTLEYFNVFLAPFVRGLESGTVKERLRSFILNAGQHVSFCISLESTVPDFVADKPAIGADGKAVGKYGDFSEEAQHLASAVLDVFSDESTTKPLLNPSLVAKIRSEAFSDERAEAILLKAHRLASEKGTVYFAALLGKENQKTASSVSGLKLRTDTGEDWEIDTLRTGCLGVISVNLPRIVYECENSTQKFSELLKERLDLATRALDLKYAALKQRGEGLLPFLTQKTNGDQYFRLESSLSLINAVGVKESVEALLGKRPCQDEKTTQFVEEMVNHASAILDKASKRRGRRFLPAMLFDIGASERLAQLDIDRYGFGKVKLSGGREKPHYSTVAKLAVQSDKLSSENPEAEQKLKQLQTGGSLAVIDLGKTELQPDQLLSLTKQAIEEHKLEFFTYTRRLTYCANCRKSWFDLLHKCPECDAVSTLSFFDRYGSA